MATLQTNKTGSQNWVYLPKNIIVGFGWRPGQQFDIKINPDGSLTLQPNNKRPPKRNIKNKAIRNKYQPEIKVIDITKELVSSTVKKETSYGETAKFKTNIYNTQEGVKVERVKLNQYY